MCVADDQVVVFGLRRYCDWVVKAQQAILNLIGIR